MKIKMFVAYSMVFWVYLQQSFERVAITFFFFFYVIKFLVLNWESRREAKQICIPVIVNVFKDMFVIMYLLCYRQTQTQTLSIFTNNVLSMWRTQTLTESILLTNLKNPSSLQFGCFLNIIKMWNEKNNLKDKQKRNSPIYWPFKVTCLSPRFVQLSGCRFLLFLFVTLPGTT